VVAHPDARLEQRQHNRRALGAAHCRHVKDG
jgi:hypothetical protein